MTDDRFEEFLRSAVHDLDPVPDIPREEMWARIDEARRFRRPSAVPAEPAIGPAKAGRRWRRWAVWPVAAAAMLAIGFWIGRTTGPDRATPEQALAAGDQPNAPATVTDRIEEESSRRVVSRGEPRRAGTRSASGPAESEREQPADAVDGPYRLAALWHLSRAEGLLTSVAVGEVDDQVADWAGEMLTTTRLMLDSPVAQDPRMARLLEDLELILVQLASTTAERRDDELQWIQQGLQTNNVLPRLRAALPADRALIGT